MEGGGEESSCLVLVVDMFVPLGLLAVSDGYGWVR